MVSIIYICINQSINVFCLLIPSQVDDTFEVHVLPDGRSTSD